jgi:hypothetical protein
MGLDYGHKRQECFHNKKRKEKHSVMTINTDHRSPTNKKKYRPPKPFFYDGEPCFKRPGLFDPETLKLLKEIGPEGNKMSTISIDTEGSGIVSGPHSAGYVSVHGCVGASKGQAVDLYFSTIQNHMIIRFSHPDNW